MKLTLYYATNRRHEGKQWTPSGYGTDFSRDGLENLRFGKVKVEADAATVAKILGTKIGGQAPGDGERLARYLSRQAAQDTTRIQPFREKIDGEASDHNQPASSKYGSEAMLDELRQCMLNAHDVVVFIHGYNVSWHDAVGSALALQCMLERGDGNMERKLQVVLFSWPSDGKMLPYVSYKSDRTDAAASGFAVGRAFLKLRDYFLKLPRIARVDGTPPDCERQIHLLCHSMGNYVLQNALQRVEEYSGGRALPRMFSDILLVAPDVDADVFEPGRAMARLPELAQAVHVYHNRGDLALAISDTTKGNPDRLGDGGAAVTALLHRKLHQIDCSLLIEGPIEHGYYLTGNVNADIRMTLDGVALDADIRMRERDPRLANVWRMRRA